MKRVLVLLALAALVTAGCRAVAPCGGCGCGCGQPAGCSDCVSCGDACGVACGDACACDCPPNVCDAMACQGGCGCGLFPRYCGPGCDDGCTYGPYDCSACGGYGCGCGAPGPGCVRSGDQRYNFAPGPPVGQTAYPYYTVRGPRDFLQDNPPPLGPY